METVINDKVSPDELVAVDLSEPDSATLLDTSPFNVSPPRFSDVVVSDRVGDGGSPVVHPWFARSTLVPELGKVVYILSCILHSFRSCFPPSSPPSF